MYEVTVENHVSFHIVCNHSLMMPLTFCGPIPGTENLGNGLQGQQPSWDAAHSLSYVWGNMSLHSGREQKEGWGLHIDLQSTSTGFGCNSFEEPKKAEGEQK